MSTTSTFITSPLKVIFSLYILSSVLFRFSVESLSLVSSRNAFKQAHNTSLDQNAEKRRFLKMQNLLSESAFGWDPSDPASTLRYKTAIDALPTSIRNAILNQTFADEIENSDLLLLDPVTIAMFQKQFKEMLTDKQLVIVLESMLDRQRFRHAAQVLELMGDRLASRPETLTSLMKDYLFSQGKRCTPDVQAFIREGLRHLTPPEKWNWTVVRKFGPGLLAALPFDVIMKIRDPQASALVLDEWLTTSTDFFGCAPVYNPNAQARFWIGHITNRRKAQIKLLYTNLGEDVKKWSPAALNRYGSLLPFLTPRILRLIDGRVAVESASALSSLKDLDDSQGYALVENLAVKNSTGLIAENSAASGSAMSRLGSLAVYLVPEYMKLSDDRRLNFLPIWAEKLDRLAEDIQFLPSWTASSLLQYRLLVLENRGNISTLQKVFSEVLSASFVRVVTWRYFKLLFSQSGPFDLGTKDALQKLSRNLASGNTFLSGQIARLSQLAIQRFKKENVWDIKNTPSIYWGGASFNDWKSVSVQDIDPVLDRVNQATKHMKPWQLAIIYYKLKEEHYELDNLKNAQVIKALAPVQHLKTLANSKSLKRMTTDMPPDSIISLLYSSFKLREGTSAESLIREPFLCSNIDSEFLESLPLFKIPLLLKSLSGSPYGPAIQMMRALNTRLKLYTKALRTDVRDNDVSLLEKTWISSFNDYPGYVLAWYRLEAIKAISPLKQIELLRSVGRLSMIDYYSIPKKVRLTILEQGLTAMGKVSEGWLGEEDLAVLGIALVDLSRDAIERLLPRAFEYSLPLLQGEAEIYEGVTARPCLSEEQRSAVRFNLKRVFGSPSTWSYSVVKIVCCSLDTLSDSELEAIRDDLILISCQGCAADDEPLFHLQHLRQRIESACLYELGPKELESGLIAGKDRLKRKRAKAALNTYRNGRVRIRGVNDQLFNTDQNVLLNCDMVLASGSGAGFTVDELLTLSDDDVQDCLYELGLSQLSLDQATAIFNRTLQVYKKPALIPQEQIKALGWVLTALNESVIGDLNLESRELVAHLGSVNWNLTQKQMETLTKNALEQYGKNPSEFTGLDLMVFGRLLCGMNASLIGEIPTLSYVEGSVFLGVILGQPGWCSSDVLYAFGRKAIQTTAFGPPFLWTAAVVRNIGAVIGGLSPEELRALPTRAMQGLTPSGARSIDPQHFKAFKQEQLYNFPLAAAQVIVAADQSYALIDEMKNALSCVIFTDANSGSSIVRSLGITFIKLQGMIINSLLKPGNVVVFVIAVICSIADIYKMR